MKKRNIWSESTEELQVHTDERGTIADIFYNQPINHLSFISTKSGGIRGNHYHKKTIQHIFLVKGKLEYWYKPLDSTKKPKMIEVVPGDLITSDANEIHTVRAVEDSEFVAITEGVRGGKDYESDTIRVESIL